MRKNMARVIGDFMAGHAHSEKSCSTDGQTVYSYSTAIAARMLDGRIVLNATKYSSTTSTQQHALRMYFAADIVVDNVPRGATRETLLALADAREAPDAQELNGAARELTEADHYNRDLALRIRNGGPFDGGAR